VSNLIPRRDCGEFIRCLSLRQRQSEGRAGARLECPRWKDFAGDRIRDRQSEFVVKDSHRSRSPNSLMSRVRSWSIPEEHMLAKSYL